MYDDQFGEFVCWLENLYVDRGALKINFSNPVPRGCDAFGQKGNEGSGNETASLVPHESMKIKR